MIHLSLIAWDAGPHTRVPQMAQSSLLFPPTAPHLDDEPLLAQLIQEFLPLDLLLAAHFVDVTYQDKVPLLFILLKGQTRGFVRVAG